MLNQLNLIGRVGNDPETRHLPSGDSVTTLSLATSRHWKNKNGEKQEEVEWFRITFFKKLAEVVSEYVHKGDLLYVSGRGKTTKWQGQDGQDNYSFGVIAQEMKMLSGKKDDNQASQASSRTQSKPTQSPPTQSGMPPVPDYVDYDDDIPF
jgi:single-strand DNA-binding protein